MDSSARPPENPYASPQVVDEPHVRDVSGKNVSRLQGQLRWMWFWCLLSGGLFAFPQVFLVFTNAPVLLDAVVGSVVLPIYLLVMATSNLMAIVYASVVEWEVKGLWFGLLCGMLVALLGFVFVVGFFVMPILLREDLNRRYGHLLNAHSE